MLDNELPLSRNIKLLIEASPLAKLLGLFTKPLLEDDRSVFTVVVENLVDIADRARTGQDKLVSHMWILGSHGCDETDTFSPTEGLESGVFDVASLKNDGGSLGAELVSLPRFGLESTHLVGTADFHDFSVAHLHSRLTTGHAGTVR